MKSLEEFLKETEEIKEKQLDEKLTEDAINTIFFLGMRSVSYPMQIVLSVVLEIMVTLAFNSLYSLIVWATNTKNPPYKLVVYLLELIRGMYAALLKKISDVKIKQNMDESEAFKIAHQYMEESNTRNLYTAMEKATKQKAPKHVQVALLEVATSSLGKRVKELKKIKRRDIQQALKQMDE